MNSNYWKEKYVICPLCNNGWAKLKRTKTSHLMLRCDDCKMLLFANSLDSEDELLRVCNVASLD